MSNQEFTNIIKKTARQLDDLQHTDVMEDILAAVKPFIGDEAPEYLLILALILAAGYAEAKMAGGVMQATMEFLPECFVDGAKIADCQCAKCKRNRNQAKSAANEMLKKINARHEP